MFTGFPNRAVVSASIKQGMNSVTVMRCPRIVHAAKRCGIKITYCANTELGLGAPASRRPVAWRWIDSLAGGTLALLCNERRHRAQAKACNNGGAECNTCDVNNSKLAP
jgi:hypothetical protein